MTRRQFLALIVPLLLVLLGFLVILVVERTGLGGAPPYDADFAAFVRERMGQEFVYGVEEPRRAWEAQFNAHNAWIRTFDPYAEVVPPWELEVSQERSSGQYGGVGIRIEAEGTRGPLEEVKVIGVQPDGPAAKAGVLVGDRIVGVDGDDLPTICPHGDDAPLRDRIRGPEGSTVALRLRAPDGEEREAKVVRDRIDTGSVFGQRWVDVEQRIAYLRLGGSPGFGGFQASSARDVREAVEDFLEEGARGLVLDLRHNGGGLLDQAVAIANLFLDEGVIVRQRGRLKEFNDVREATADTVSADLPLAVLVDKGSASASEILAGALQDHRRAVIVGTWTWGKFLVQMVEEVPMQAGRALFKRTTSIYETPSGHHYQRDPRLERDPMAGIAPDVYVPLESEELDKIREIFANEFYADWNPEQPPVHADFSDPQLDAAVAILRGETAYPRLVTLRADGR